MDEQYYRHLHLYTDGSSKPNPGPSGIAFILIDPLSQNVVYEGMGYVGSSTNNKAEYSAIILGLDVARRYSCRKLTVFSDSQLVILQAQKYFRVRNFSLDRYFLKLRQLMDTYFLEGVDFVHINNASAIPFYEQKWHFICDKNSKLARRVQTPVLNITF